MSFTKRSAALLLAFCSLGYADQPLTIHQKPIPFNAERTLLTEQYMQKHYGIYQKGIRIQPKMIVIHYTATPTLEDTLDYFSPTKITDRKYLSETSHLNVSAQFLVDRDGTVYQLMPINWMARHIIGLNYLAIGIENIGGMGAKQDLTPAQLQANIALIRYLKNKYPGIQYLIGHYEYGIFRNTPLWKEKDKSYFTNKTDPGSSFMRAIRNAVKDLNLKPGATQPDPTIESEEAVQHTME